MPVYRQYRYFKERDCIHCKFYHQGECHHPLPNEYHCNFITRKEFTHKYFFKTSIQGRGVVRRGFKTKEAAREAETYLRREFIVDDYIRLKMPREPLPKYQSLLQLYSDHLKKYKISSYQYIKLRIQNYYSSLFP